MADEELFLYLRLTPEFGGTRFGPFEGVEVRLGSEQGANDIVVPETFGVAPAHVKLLRQEGMGLILAPVERTAAVFLFKGRATRPRQVVTPVAVRPGDSFALATPDGPRFLLEMGELPEEMKKAREAKRWSGRRPTAGALGAEAKRQVWVKLLTTGVGQGAQRAWTFVKSGAILRPRNIFLMVAVAGGYIFGGAQACGKLSLRKKLSANTQQLDECQKEATLNQGGGKGFSFPGLARDVTGAASLQVALTEDERLSDLVRRKAEEIFSFPDRYSWLVDPEQAGRRTQRFARARERLAKSDALPPDVAALLPYATAEPEVSRDGWKVLPDSQGDDACARGPFSLTWRQGRNLGLQARLDAVIKGSPKELEPESARPQRQQLLMQTALRSGLEEPEDLSGDFATRIDTVNQGLLEYCLVVDGDDERDRLRSVARAVDRRLGSGASGLPPAGTAPGTTARLAALYAADLPCASRSRGCVDLSGGHVGRSLMQIKDKGGDWVLDRTAEVIARAIAVPCLAVIGTRDSEGLADTFGDRRPRFLDCIVMEAMLQHHL